jgi:hypothetical protein
LASSCGKGAIVRHNESKHSGKLHPYSERLDAELVARRVIAATVGMFYIGRFSDL